MTRSSQLTWALCTSASYPKPNLANRPQLLFFDYWGQFFHIGDIVSEADAYLAGLFDGEGWVSISYHTKQDHYTLQIGIKMVNKDAIDFVNTLYPGKVYAESHNEQGWLDSYKWVLNGAKARPFIEAVLPYCRVKALPLRLALQYIDTISKSAPNKLGVEVNADRAQLREQLIKYNKVN